MLDSFSVHIVVDLPDDFSVIRKFQNHVDQSRIQIIDEYQQQNWTQNGPLWYSASNCSPNRFTAADANSLFLM